MKMQRLIGVAVGATFGLTAMAAAAPGELDFEAAAKRAEGERFVVNDFDIERPGWTEVIGLELERFEILAPDAEIVVGAGPDARRIAPPDLVLLRGRVAGDAGSRVFMAIAPNGTNGFIEDQYGSVSISSGAHADRDFAMRAADTRMLTFDPTAPATVCQTVEGDPDGAPFNDAGPGGLDALPIGGLPCRRARIAVETDWEFTQDQGGDVNASTAYALTLMAASSEIYRTQLNLRLAVSFLRVYDQNNDPWTATSSGSALGEVRDYFVQNEGALSRELVHFLSGKGLGGGVAWVDVVCNENNGYAVSGSLNGFFPYPMQDYNGANWDIIVVSHELGHNFGSPHTHSYSPPIDGCGNDDCADAFGGTIMSYCHLCSGGIGNIQLSFHPTVVNHLAADLNQTCNLVISGQTAVNDTVAAVTGQAVIVDVLRNDQDVSCETVDLVSFDATTSAGGTVELLPMGQGGIPRDRLRVTVTGAGTETFSYSIGGDTAVVFIDVTLGGACCLSDGSCEAVTAESCASQGGIYLADLSSCSTSVCVGGCCLPDGTCTEVVAAECAAAGGEYQGDGDSCALTNCVPPAFGGCCFVDGTCGTVFDYECESAGGFFLGLNSTCVGVTCPAPTGACCVDGDVCFDTDPVTCTIAGGTYSGDGTECAATACEGATCPADVDGNGTVAFDDLVQVLSAWGPCDGCPADLDGSGQVDFSDLVSVLSGWGDCP